MVLDNPIWSALETEQAEFAHGNGAMRWYPENVAPFCAVARQGEAVDRAAMTAAMDGCAVRYFVGVLPLLPSGFRGSGPITLLQMACFALSGGGDDRGEVRDLGTEDADAMLALTGLAFPGFFRRRTLDMGRYIGVVRNGQLLAMGGERLLLPGYRELSAICTHPAHTGNGYARTIVRRLSARILSEGRIPFLHVRDANAGARHLYEASGFTVVNTVNLMTVNPDPPQPVAP